MEHIVHSSAQGVTWTVFPFTMVPPLTWMGRARQHTICANALQEGISQFKMFSRKMKYKSSISLLFCAHPCWNVKDTQKTKLLILISLPILHSSMKIYISNEASSIFLTATWSLTADVIKANSKALTS